VARVVVNVYGGGVDSWNGARGMGHGNGGKKTKLLTVLLLRC